jgi:hypothetical protein
MQQKKIEKEASKKHPMENKALSTQKFQEITKAEKIK